MDIVFWQKLTTYPGHITQRTYQPTDLEQAGYTYEYLSPDNFEFPLAVVKDGILAPDAQAFKAMVVRASDSLTLAGVTKLVEFAQAGLPIIFSGGIPTFYLGTNSPSSLEEANNSLQNITTLHNVHVTDASELSSTLPSIGIVPYTKLSTNSNWYTMRRHDNDSGTDHIFIYNDAVPNGQILLSISHSPRPGIPTRTMLGQARSRRFSPIQGQVIQQPFQLRLLVISLPLSPSLLHLCKNRSQICIWPMFHPPSTL